MEFSPTLLATDTSRVSGAFFASKTRILVEVDG